MERAETELQHEEAQLKVSLQKKEGECVLDEALCQEHARNQRLVCRLCRWAGSSKEDLTSKKCWTWQTSKWAHTLSYQSLKARDTGESLLHYISVSVYSVPIGTHSACVQADYLALTGGEWMVVCILSKSGWWCGHLVLSHHCFLLLPQTLL